MEDELEGFAAERLAVACADAGFVSGWAIEIPWTPIQRIVSASRLALTAQAIQALAKDVCLASCYLLVEDSQRFAVASDGDAYWMLGGNRTFIEAVTGTTVEQQLARFQEVAQSYNQPGSLAGIRLGAVQAAAIEAYQARPRAANPAR